MTGIDTSSERRAREEKEERDLGGLGDLRLSWQEMEMMDSLIHSGGEREKEEGERERSWIPPYPWNGWIHQSGWLGSVEVRKTSRNDGRFQY